MVIRTATSTATGRSGGACRDVSGELMACASDRSGNLRPLPNSRSHVLRHSGVDRIWLTWQHRSSVELVVLHLELEPKALIIAFI